eukprot:g47373.t1
MHTRAVQRLATRDGCGEKSERARMSVSGSTFHVGVALLALNFFLRVLFRAAAFPDKISRETLDEFLAVSCLLWL